MGKSLKGLVMLVALSAIQYDQDVFATGVTLGVRTKDAGPLLDVKAAREATEDEIAAFVADDGSTKTEGGAATGKDATGGQAGDGAVAGEAGTSAAAGGAASEAATGDSATPKAGADVAQGSMATAADTNAEPAMKTAKAAAKTANKNKK